MDFKDIAWNNFYKTGDIESFLEYKKINETQQIMQNLGVMIDEINQGQGDSNKRSTI